MICQLVEEHLQQLLDERRDLEAFIGSDHPLAWHARQCGACAGVTAALELMGAMVPCESAPVTDLAARVVATLRSEAVLPPAGVAAHERSVGWRGALAGMALAAGLLIAIGLKEGFSPHGGEADGSAAAELANVRVASSPQEPDSKRWYPRGVGIASLSMAVLTKGNLDMRQVSTPSDEPLLQRAMEAVRRVLPAWDPETTPNSKTGANAPVLPQLV